MGVRQVVRECVQHLVVELAQVVVQEHVQDAQDVVELVLMVAQEDAQAVVELVLMVAQEDVQEDVLVVVVVTVEEHVQEQNFVVEDAQGVAQAVTRTALGQK